MKVLIFGGNRFVGKRVLAAIAAQGHNITLINRGRLEDGVNSPLIKRAHFDRADPAEMEKFFGNANDHYDLVFDFACFYPEQVFLTLKHLDGKVGRYVFISTQSVYPPGENINVPESWFDPYTFNIKQIPDSKELDYSRAKQFAEAVFFQKAKFPVIALRFSFILGPDDYTQRLQFHVDRVKQGLPIYFPSIDSRISMIHAQDAAEVVLTLGFTSLFTGPLNVCSKEPISLREMVHLIEKNTGKKAVFSYKEEAGNHSPYGVDTDRFMSTEKLNSLRIRVRPILDWLPDLI